MGIGRAGGSLKVFYRRLSAAASSQSPSSTVTLAAAVPRARCPSLEEFTSRWYDPALPLVIEGEMENWAARHWTLDSLAKDFGHETVHIELSRWNDEEKRWADFRDLYKSKSASPTEDLFVPQHPMLLEDFIDLFLKKFDEKSSPLRGYLAQQQLLEELPAMAEGILEPSFARLGRGIYQKNVWLGPVGTISPLHRDPYHNILAQVWGKKYIRIFSPTESSKLYPFEHNMYLHNTSQVDVDAQDAYKRWPELQKAPYFECVLNAGEMLYIPIKWWHYVRANELSFSVSFWSVK